MAQVATGSPDGERPSPVPPPPGAVFSPEQKEYLEGFLRALTAPTSPSIPTLEGGGNGGVGAAAQQAWLNAGKRLSKEEQIKAEGNPLDAWPSIEELSAKNRLPEGADVFRFKFHGLFNVAPAQNAMMCRLRFPGGALTSAQLASVADCAERYGGGYADITTRANLQIREIPGRHMADLLSDLHQAGIMPRGSGADNIRNVTGNPTSGIDPDEFLDVLPLCRKLHHHILHNRDLYGLPRKFNIAFDGGNSISALEDTNDIGFRAARVEEAEAVPEVPAGVYFRVALGGITGHKDFARDTGLLVKPEECLGLAVAMVRVFIAHGDRGNRKKARLKYVLDQKGFGWFLEETQKRLPFALRRFPLDKCRLAPPADRLAHLGARPQRQEGRFWVGVDVPVGRLTVRQMRGIADLAARFGSGSIRLTVWQNLLIADVPKKRLLDVLGGLKTLGLFCEPDPVSAGLVACTGAEGCKFGMAATKGTALAVLEHLREARRDGRLVLDRPVNIHLTGCPHSCAQHFIGDIGLLATTTERDGIAVPAFHLFVGGGFQDQARIAVPVAREVPLPEVPHMVENMLRFYVEHRLGDESFSDFTRRRGDSELETLFTAAARPLAAAAA